MEDENKRRRISFSLSKLECGLKKSTPGKFAHTCHFLQIGLNATKIEKTEIHFKTDVFAAVAVVDAKAPYSRKVPDMAAVTSPENALIVVYCSLYLHKNMISSFMPKSCIRSMG